MANENLSDETMIEVLKTVKLWDIFSKAKGLDTVLESQGKKPIWWTSTESCSCKSITI